MSIRVVELLRRGRTVAWVADATTWPRADVLRFAEEAGLRHDSATDTCEPVNPDDAPDFTGVSEQIAGSVDQQYALVEKLTRRGAASPIPETRAQAQLVRTATLKLAEHRRILERLLAAEAEQVERIIDRERLRARLAARRSSAADPDAVHRPRRSQPRPADADYPVAVVRKWAKAQGLDVPAHGRYLPRSIVAAWRAAAETTRPEAAT